jgi:predicted patatin/cPLA2 family phospholipase
MVGATDVDTGDEMVYDFDDLLENEYVNAIVASSSVPVVFPYTRLRNRSLVDSLSTGWNVNMISAIEKCMELVHDHKKIELDIVVMYDNRMRESPNLVN